jgi:DNA-binding Lrp family transcriptional regulator
VRPLEKFDENDRRIVSLLMEKPDMSQTAIASHLKLSQPAVYARIRRLRTSGILTRVVGVNLTGINLHMVKVEITAKEPWKIVDFFDKCPMFVNGFIISGRHNLCLFFVSERLQAIECCVNHNLRKNPNVLDAESNVVVTPVKDFVVPLKIYSEKREKSPCGKTCAEQSCYPDGKCLGCPATVFYKGKLL